MKKLTRNIYVITQMILLIAFIPNKSSAQKGTVGDSSYYISYPQNVLVRTYLSQKFAPFTIPSQSDKEISYKTNSKLNFGVGVTYKSYTLNLSYGFKFLNVDKGQGKTKGLDLQFHIFPHKLSVDLIGSFIKGYYLKPNDNSGLNLNTYYQRPDLSRNIIGVSVARVLNHNKFSYKAVVNQNEWQKKSAGSFLFGGEAYYGTIKGDSALVPNKLSSFFEQKGITKINFFSVGPGVGYAYTLVLSNHFFIGGSVIASLDVNFSSEEKSDGKHSKVNFIPDGTYKGAVGYNSNTWSVSANVLGNSLYSGSAFTSKQYFLPTGNIRFTVAKKLGIKTR